MTTNPSLSIIIANYNYAAYVGHAIESALAVCWDQREVIVVDDGSTDNSLAVIGKFEGRIKIIRQSNLGQTQSYRRGFDLSCGDVIIFLDADDMLDPAIMTEIIKVWHDGISKVQVQVATINAEGTTVGGCIRSFMRFPVHNRSGSGRSKPARTPRRLVPETPMHAGLSAGCSSCRHLSSTEPTIAISWQQLRFWVTSLRLQSHWRRIVFTARTRVPKRSSTTLALQTKSNVPGAGLRFPWKSPPLQI
jgi:glycosyltransferase involved in cell wall biosynthesis